MKPGVEGSKPFGWKATGADILANAQRDRSATLNRHVNSQTDHSKTRLRRA